MMLLAMKTDVIGAFWSTDLWHSLTVVHCHVTFAWVHQYTVSRFQGASNSWLWFSGICSKLVNPIFKVMSFIVVCCNACPRVPLNGCFLGLQKTIIGSRLFCVVGIIQCPFVCITSIGNHSPIQNTKKLTSQFDVSSVNGVHAAMWLSKTQYFSCTYGIRFLLVSPM